MTFNPDADISGGKGSRRGRNTAIGLGGGGLGVLAIVLLGSLFGVDLSGLVGGAPGGGAPVVEGESLDECRTGEDANQRVECRVVGASASLEEFWVDAAPTIGVEYVGPQDVVLFTQSTSTGCGGATSATGPFYCPPDQTIYMDTTFFGELSNRFGASTGPLAEMYVVAHEWGHHVQNIAGILQAAQDGDTGPASNSVRIELQADCFAGAWAGAASATRDDEGVAFLQPLTTQDISDALSAAGAVGDDRIQSATQGQVQPHTFTHGTSEQRQDWFERGYEQGPGACDTFRVGPDDL